MWPRIINALLGLWLMVSPAVLGLDNTQATNDHIVGPLIITFAVTAIWEVTRVVRWYNVPLAAWLLLAPWVLGYDSSVAISNDMIVGALVLIFSLVKGSKVSQRYGGGWMAIWKSDSLHVREAKNRQRSNG